MGNPGRTQGRHAKRKRALAIGTSVLTAAAAGLQLAAATSSPATPVSITLKYTCPYPVIGKQPLSIQIRTDIPKSIPVDQPMPKLKIDAVATVNDASTDGMNLVGAKSLEGQAVANATAHVPEGQLPVKTHVALEKTRIPAQGEFQVNAHGEGAALTFTKPGKGTITVGDLKITMTPRDKDGDKTLLGTFESACKQNAGQNNKLAEFEITSGGGPTVSPTKSTTSTVDPTKSSTPTVDPTKSSTPTVDPTKSSTPTVELAESGSSSSTPLIGGGAALLIVAVGGIVWAARKRRHAQH